MTQRTFTDRIAGGLKQCTGISVSVPYRAKNYAVNFFHPCAVAASAGRSKFLLPSDGRFEFRAIGNLALLIWPRPTLGPGVAFIIFLRASAR